MNCALNSAIVAVILHCLCAKLENKEIVPRDLVKLAVLVVASVCIGYRLKLVDSLLK